jgi:hypothetical protein
MIEYINSISISPLDLWELLITSFLNIQLVRTNVFNLMNLVNCLFCMRKNADNFESREEENSFQINSDQKLRDNFVLTCYQRCIKICENSSNLQNALILAWTVRSSINQVYF